MTEFRVLLAAHVASDPPEATLVLAAAAAFCGVCIDGSTMPGAAPRAPSLRDLANEIGLHVGAVRRGVRHLEAAGLVRVAGGVEVLVAAVQARWTARSTTIRLSADLRQAGLRARPLLVAGVVAGNLDQRGRLVLGHDRLGARVGMPRRTLQRALAAAESAGAVRHWLIPGTWLPCFTAGTPPTHREGAQEKRREEAEEKRPGLVQRREEAHPPSRRGARVQRREEAHPPSRRGARQPGLLSDQTESDPDTRASAREAENSGVQNQKDQKQNPGASSTSPVGEPEADEEALLRRALLRTTLRKRVPSLPRMIWAIEFARTLHSAGMRGSELDRLWNIAQQRTDRTDPGGLLAAMLAGNWRETLDVADERADHAAAAARGAAARASGDDVITTPEPIAGAVAAVVARARHA